MRAGRTARVMAGICVAAVALVLAVPAAPALGAGSVTSMPPVSSPLASPVALPRAPSSDASSSQRVSEALGAQAQALDAFVARSGLPPVGVSAQAAPSGVAIPFGGFYYWVGTTLVVEGWVSNDTAADVGPIEVGIVIQSGAGADVARFRTYAVAYNLPPGQLAVFQGINTELAAYAGQNMQVLVTTLATQPTEFPDAVELTLVSGEYTVRSDGSRAYRLMFRNDSGVDVWMPLIGGFELDSADDPQAVIFGAEADVRLLSGATLPLNARALYPGVTPVRAAAYAQALPAPPSQPVPVYRFYNIRNNSHFYTPSAEERDRVSASLGHVYRYEGVAYSTDGATNNQPLYRFFYKRGGTHFYTADVEEAALIQLRWSDLFTYEGQTYPVNRTQTPGALTVYRFLNRRNSSHFYTASAQERDYVQANLSGTYIYEGPAFYIAP